MAAPSSPAWLAELGERLSGLVVGEAGSRRLLLGVRVEEESGESVAYTVALGGGAPAEVLAGTESAVVTLVESAETADSLRGGSSISDALGRGLVKLEGDVSALLGAEDELEALAAALA